MKSAFIPSFFLACSFAIAAQEITLGFDTPPARKNHVAAGWFQNKSPVFKPYGTVSVIDAPFEKFKKALRIASTGKSTDVATVKTIPAKVGDAFAVTVVFRSPDGKSKARVGTYGEYQACEFAPVGTDWDMRSAVFEIKKETTEKVQFFVAAGENSVLEYSNLRIKRLTAADTGAYTPGKMRALWRERIKGVNLAAGRKVSFLPKPNYPLTAKGGTDDTDLTDGRLGKPNEMLWFNKEAVAWYRALHGVTIVVDLGSVQPVEKAVMRINGGRLGGGVTFPVILEAWVSRDGKNFHLAHSMKKVAESESNVADWKELYYLPETADESTPVYVYPFELKINADARYVAVRAPIYTALMMISDELAVMKAAPENRKNPDYNSAYKKNSRPLVHSNMIIQPKLDVFYVASNMKLPNWLSADCRLPDENVKFAYSINLPEQVLFTEEKSWPQTPRTLVRTERKNGRVVYYFEPKMKFDAFLRTISQFQFGPFFFSTNGKEIPDGQKYVVFTTFVNGKENYAHKMPLEILNIPEVADLKRLNISLAWTENRHFASYPDYLDTQKKLGFNTLPLFPLSKDAPQAGKLIREAAGRGYLIRQQMSPSHLLPVWHKNETEFKCVGAEKLRSVCPAYRGRYYTEMLNAIKNAVRDYPADYVTFDEEVWGVPILEAMTKCSRCDALRKSKKMDWKTYLEWAMADYLSAYKKAVHEGARAAKRKPPVMSFYALVPDNIKTTSVGKVCFLGYPNLWPKFADELQDSYYGRSSLTASIRARNVFASVKNPAKICAWITGGSGAHTETAYPARTGQHLIETLMNGAGGIQYFMYPSFESPLDYYYHARAMKLIQPYEDILMDGSLDFNFSGTDKSLRYTKRSLGKVDLILIGAYESVGAKKTVIPMNGAKNAVDLISGKAIEINKDGTASVTVPADDFILIKTVR